MGVAQGASTQGRWRVKKPDVAPCQAYPWIRWPCGFYRQCGVDAGRAPRRCPKVEELREWARKQVRKDRLLYVPPAYRGDLERALANIRQQFPDCGEPVVTFRGGTATSARAQRRWNLPRERPEDAAKRPSPGDPQWHKLEMGGEGEES